MAEREIFLLPTSTKNLDIRHSPKQVRYVEGTRYDRAIAALRECRKALNDRLHHDEWETIDDYPYTAIPIADAALAECEGPE